MSSCKYKQEVTRPIKFERVRNLVYPWDRPIRDRLTHRNSWLCANNVALDMHTYLTITYILYCTIHQICMLISVAEPTRHNISYVSTYLFLKESIMVLLQTKQRWNYTCIHKKWSAKKLTYFSKREYYGFCLTFDFHRKYK
jgi:hypothetical protein